MVSGSLFKSLSRHLGALILLAALTAPAAHAVDPQNGGGALAGGTAAAPAEPGLDWYRPNDPLCRQGCTYEKANENLRLLIQYQQLKLAQLYEDVEGPSPNLDRARSLLGDFCVSGEKYARPGNDLDNATNQCYHRYERAQTLALGRLRADLVKNEDAQGKLRSEQVAADGKSGPEAKGAARAAFLPSAALSQELAGQKPSGGLYFFSLKDIQKRYELSLEEARASISPRFEKWTEDLARPPSIDEFVKTKKILRDPGNPDAGTLTVIETGPDGKPVYDQKAFKEAMAAFKDHEATVKGDRSKYVNAAERKAYVDPKRLQGKSKEKLLTATAADNVKIFKQAHDGIVETINGDLAKKNLVSTAPPKPKAPPAKPGDPPRPGDRALAAAPPPKSPTAAGGSEKVTLDAATLRAEQNKGNFDGNRELKELTPGKYPRLEMDHEALQETHEDLYYDVFTPKNRPRPTPRRKRAPSAAAGNPVPGTSSPASGPGNATGPSGGTAAAPLNDYRDVVHSDLN